jgi:hypothetical protein
VLVVSVSLAWFAREGADKFAAAEAIALFYVLALLIVVEFFGGLHGAPSWSELPVLVISFTLQNLALWYTSKWIAGRLTRTARET